MIRKMKIQLQRVLHLGILGLALAIASSTARADVQSAMPHADDRDSGQCSLPPGHGGGDVPSPFTINQHVELAVGEFYTLTGTVVARASAASSGVQATSAQAVPYFAVDLSQHPWLANVIRKQDPYYRLEGGWGFWNRFLQKRVTATVQARAQFVGQSPDGGLSIEIVLRPMDTGAVVPVLAAEQGVK